MLNQLEILRRLTLVLSLGLTPVFIWGMPGHILEDTPAQGTHLALPPLPRCPQYTVGAAGRLCLGV